MRSKNAELEARLVHLDTAVAALQQEFDPLSLLYAMWGAVPFTGRHLQTLYGRLHSELRIGLLRNAYSLRTTGVMPGVAERWVGYEAAAIVACPPQEDPDPRHAKALEAAIAAGAPYRRTDDRWLSPSFDRTGLLESITADLMRMVLRTPTADQLRATVEDWIRNGEPELPEPPREQRSFLRLFYEWSRSDTHPLLREPPPEAPKREAIDMTTVDWNDLEFDDDDDDDDEPNGDNRERRSARSPWQPPPLV